MVPQKQTSEIYQPQSMHTIPEADTHVFPILASIGVPVEIMGITTCEMSGFCQIFDEDEDGPDNQPGHKQNDNESLPGENSNTRTKHPDYDIIVQCRQVRGKISTTESAGELIFFFPIATMRRCTRAKYFDKRFFSIQASITLPHSLCCKLYLPVNSRLIPQQCLILKKNQGYELRVLIKPDFTC